MAQRGGKRPGAGRPKGARDRATREQGATIAELARSHTDEAISALVHVAMHGESEAARVSAATAILDRGYGRCAQQLAHSVEVDYNDLSEEELDRRIEELAARCGYIRADSADHNL